MSLMALAAAFVLLVLPVSLGLRTRLQRIARGRAGETFADFAASFTESDVPVGVLRQVYESVQLGIRIPTFPVRADDDIGKMFGIVDDDLDDLLLDVLRRLSCRVPAPNDPVSGRSLITVRDLVMYVSCLYPRVGSTR